MANLPSKYQFSTTSDSGSSPFSLKMVIFVWEIFNNFFPHGYSNFLNFKKIGDECYHLATLSTPPNLTVNTGLSIDLGMTVKFELQAGLWTLHNYFVMNVVICNSISMYFIEYPISEHRYFFLIFFHCCSLF